MIENKVIADMKYWSRHEDNPDDSKRIVRLMLNRDVGEVALDFNPGLKKGDALTLKINMRDLMAALGELAASKDSYC